MGQTKRRCHKFARNSHSFSWTKTCTGNLSDVAGIDSVTWRCSLALTQRRLWRLLQKSLKYNQISMCGGRHLPATNSDRSDYFYFNRPVYEFSVNCSICWMRKLRKMEPSISYLWLPEYDTAETNSIDLMRPIQSGSVQNRYENISLKSARTVNLMETDFDCM